MTTKTNITELERKVLDAIKENPFYQEGAGMAPMDEVTNCLNAASRGGVVASLIKKNLVSEYDNGNGPDDLWLVPEEGALS